MLMYSTISECIALEMMLLYSAAALQDLLQLPLQVYLNAQFRRVYNGSGPGNVPSPSPRPNTPSPAYFEPAGAPCRADEELRREMICYLHIF